MARKPNGNSTDRQVKAPARTVEAKPVEPRGEARASAPAPKAGFKAKAPVAAAPVPSIPSAAPAALGVAAKAEPVTKPVAQSQAPSQVLPVESAPVVEPQPAMEPAAPPAPQPSIQELKEKIMATQPNVEAEQITRSMTAALGDMQERAKSAYEKGTASMSEMTEFAKGNVEAVVESGKILAATMQDMSKSAVDEAKSAYETATADLKEMAAIKSPTELFQLQGKIARRNFDAMVAASSRNTEMMMKMVGEVFAPISSRVNIATDKFSKTTV